MFCDSHANCLISSRGVDIGVERVAAVVEWFEAMTDGMSDCVAFQTVIKPIMEEERTLLLSELTPEGGAQGRTQRMI